MTQVSGALTVELGNLDTAVTQQVISALGPILERIEAKVSDSNKVPGYEILGPRQTYTTVAGHLPAGVGSVGCPTPEDVASYLVRYLRDSGYVLAKVVNNG